MGLGQASFRGQVHRWQAALAVLLALVGFVMVAQIRTEWLIKRALRIPSTQLAELAFTLRDQERHRAALETQVVELRARLVDYERAATEGRTAAARTARSLQEMRALVGLTPLEGPGIVLELNDSRRAPLPGEDPNKTILHYSDIAAVVAELWAAGAEAIALNGERIVASTGINCVGTTILCNTKRVAPPYVITAIGDPARLRQYLRQPGGGLELLAAFDFPIRLTVRRLVQVPAYRGTYRFEHTTITVQE
ncbi:MAG: DUF881 domain-containing protein [Armatimonadota bacterium]